MDIIKDQLKEASHLLNKIIDDKLVINSISEASQILLDRPVGGFTDKEEFWSHPVLENIQRNNNINEYLSFSSNYYILETKVSNPIKSYKMTSVFFINKSNKVSVIIRNLGDL